MKSNMSSLTKKLLFFLVFSFLSNSTTSNAVMDCVYKLEVIFRRHCMPNFNFGIAMGALSEKLIDSNFILNNADNLFEYFASFGDAIKNIGDEIFNLIHNEMLDYFDDHPLSPLKLKNDSFLAQVQEEILGYFHSFVAKIENPQHPYISDWIESNTMSPHGFCEHRSTYGLSEVDLDACNEALCTMLNLEDDNETTKMEKFMTMTGSQAFKYCYLNYTYLDFTTNNTGSSSGSLQPNMDPSELNIRIKYFSHLLQASLRIRQYYESVDRRLFFTVQDYCRNAVNRRRS